MNWNYFGIAGHVSVLLWVLVPLLWLIHAKLKRRVLCQLALVLAVAAFVMAKINSETYVNRIQLEQVEETVSLEQQQELKRKLMLEDRSAEVAQKRFAEDGADDFLDKAGMEDEDLKQMQKLEQPVEPAWKKEKKTRTGNAPDDDSLDSMVGGDGAIDGVESEFSEAAEEQAPILMTAEDMAMANRLDGINLKLIRILILIAVLIVIVDYLRRANLYRSATFPLPLPSAWINALTPVPPVFVRPGRARRSVPKELAWLAKRGDSFVYLTDDPAAANKVPESLSRFGKRRPEDVLRVSEGEDDIGDDFVFETLWYGRSSFVVDSAARAERMFDRFIELLDERRTVRAKVSQTVHIVWDMSVPLSEAQQQEFSILAKKTGFSLFLCTGDGGKV